MNCELSYEDKAVHFETWEHIHQVRKLLTVLIVELTQRALLHDQSKIYTVEECKVFTGYTPLLKNLEYGSEEYRNCLKQMASAISHHYKNNRHHPEYHSEGISGMNLIDLVEMVCDWKAATLRTKDGDIHKSINIQRERFGISDQLISIIKNTIPLLEDIK
jgi:hypothetical protein